MTSKIVIWNTEDYASREAAEADKATHEHIIKSCIASHNVPNFIDAYAWGLTDACSKLLGNPDALQYEVVELHTYNVKAQVLEWNTYTVPILAESEEEALLLATENSVVSFNHADVEWGTEGYAGDDVSQKDERIL